MCLRKSHYVIISVVAYAILITLFILNRNDGLNFNDFLWACYHGPDHSNLTVWDSFNCQWDVLNSYIGELLIT